MVPMQAPELAVEEIGRAAKLPGIRGVYMATHVMGKNLEEKEFWPVYARCEALGLPIFLHPVNPVGAERMRKYHLRNLIGNPTESGIARRLLPGFRFGELFFQLADAVLHSRQTRIEQADVEELHVVSRRIERVAVAEPGRIVNLDVFKAELL